MGAVSRVDDLGDTRNPVFQDALEPGLERDRGSGAGHACAGEFDGDNTCDFVDIMKHHIAIVSLNCRANDLDDLLNLCSHISQCRERRAHDHLRPLA